MTSVLICFSPNTIFAPRKLYYTQFNSIDLTGICFPDMKDLVPPEVADNLVMDTEYFSYNIVGNYYFSIPYIHVFGFNAFIHCYTYAHLVKFTSDPICNIPNEMLSSLRFINKCNNKKFIPLEPVKQFVWGHFNLTDDQGMTQCVGSHCPPTAEYKQTT